MAAESASDNQLSSEYHKARWLVVACAILTLLDHFGFRVDGPLPLVGVTLPDPRLIPAILGAILAYGVLRVILDWFHSSREARSRLLSKADLLTTIVIGGVGLWPLAGSNSVLTGLRAYPVVPTTALLLLGIGTGIFLGESAQVAFLIRPAAEAQRLALPRIPVVTRAVWRMTLYGVLPACTLAALLGPFLSPPLDAAWYWLVGVPIFLIPLAGLLQLRFGRYRVRDGRLVGYREYLAGIREGTKWHDSQYQVGGWDSRVTASPSSLYMSALRGDVESVRRLLAQGENPDKQEERGWTPLHIAAANRHGAVVDVLLQSGANPNLCNVDGRSALFYVAWAGDVPLVQKLTEYGADPNLRNRFDGHTPLVAAVRGGHMDIVQLLLELGADPEVKDAHGRTAREVAEEVRQGDIATALRMAARKSVR